jgi:hypothetical protein
VVLGTLIAFPMLENVVLKDIGTAATAALNSVPLELLSPVFPIVLKEQCVSKNVINIKISIFDFFIHLAPKKQPCRLCHRTTFQLPLIQTTVEKDKKHLEEQLWSSASTLVDGPLSELKGGLPSCRTMCLTGASKKGNLYQKYAIKCVSKASLSNGRGAYADAATRLATKTIMLILLKHKNIVRIQGIANNGLAGFLDGTQKSFFTIVDRLACTLDQTFGWRVLWIKPLHDGDTMSSKPGPERNIVKTLINLLTSTVRGIFSLVSYKNDCKWRSTLHRQWNTCTLMVSYIAISSHMRLVLTARGI